MVFSQFIEIDCIFGNCMWVKDNCQLQDNTYNEPKFKLLVPKALYRV